MRNKLREKRRERRRVPVCEAVEWHLFRGRKTPFPPSFGACQAACEKLTITQEENRSGRASTAPAPDLSLIAVTRCESSTGTRRLNILHIKWLFWFVAKNSWGALERGAVWIWSGVSRAYISPWMCFQCVFVWVASRVQTASDDLRGRCEERTTGRGWRCCLQLDNTAKLNEITNQSSDPFSAAKRWWKLRKVWFLTRGPDLTLEANLG